MVVLLFLLHQEDNFCPGNDTMTSCPEGQVAPTTGATKCIPANSPCVSGTNYYFAGWTSSCGGDPRMTTFRSSMSFQGTGGGQYYYVTSCAGVDHIGMPFSVIGSHSTFRNSMTQLDYVVVELTEMDGTLHLLFLHPTHGGYIENAKIGTSTVLDDHVGKLKKFKVGKLKFAGRTRFLVQVVSRSIRIYLFIDGKKVTDINVVSWGSWFNKQKKRGESVAMTMTPPVGFRCRACGLMGDFKNKKNVMSTCAGGKLDLTGRTSGANSLMFSKSGLTWRKGYCTPGLPAVAAFIEKEREDLQVEVEADAKQRDSCVPKSENERVAKRECKKEFDKVKKELCTGNLVQLCTRLHDWCVRDLCRAGPVKREKGEAKAYAAQLAQLLSEKKMLQVEEDPIRNRREGRADMACGTKALSQFAPGNWMRSVANYRRQQPNGALPRRDVSILHYDTALSCSKNGNILTVIHGFFFLSNKAISLRVSAAPNTRWEGKLTSATTMNAEVHSVGISFVASCVASGSVAIVDVSPSIAHPLSRVVGTASFNMACSVPLKWFAGLTKLEIGGSRPSKLAFGMQVRVTSTRSKQKSAHVTFTTWAGVRLKSIGGALLVYCPDPKKKVGPKKIQSGEFTIASGKTSVKVAFSSAMVCMNPTIGVSLTRLELSRRLEFGLSVMENSESAFGFQVAVTVVGNPLISGPVRGMFIALCPE